MPVGVLGIGSRLVSIMPQTNGSTSSVAGRTLLIVDDDETFRLRLLRAFRARGHVAYDAPSGEAALPLVRQHRPDGAVIDLRMPGMGGLALISELVAIHPAMQVVVLTGYGNIPTAVDAVRRGAMDYLTKPVDADQILAVFNRDEQAGQPAAAAEDAGPIPSLARVEWEHIQRILNDCGGNISLTARKLGIHRRSLQRKLGKLPPLE